MSPESLPVKLRQARGAMSLAEAAELAGIPEERIRMYEEGVRRPYGKTLRRLADVYRVRVAELIGPGRAVRSAGRRPAARRRRPIEVPATVHENGTVAVPLEVAEGQTIRLVIELVVKARQPAAPVPAEEPEEAAEAAAEPPPAAGLPSPGRAPQPRTPAEPLAARRRPEVLQGGEPMDPIIELKRAYRDFRHKKT